MSHVTVENLTFTYPGGTEPALSQVSFSLHAGEFVTLCGPSGCGKTTLLRHLKPELAPHGKRSGRILFHDRELSSLDLREQAAAIGFVQQSPENQIVTDKVWHELAFGLESLGMDGAVIRRRVAETALFFGIQNWFHRDVASLSGGQKQLLNLAAVLVMQPELLILDEPTSQLDPVAASNFLAVLGRINRELGVTILLTEHRLEEVFPLSDRALVLDQGRLIADAPPVQAGQLLRSSGHRMFRAMPVAMRVWAAVPSETACPVTVREGRTWLEDYAADHTLDPAVPEDPAPASDEAALTLDAVSFRYEKDAPEVLKDLSLTVRRGEFLAVLGGNGAGKTTLLSVAAGLLTPQHGARTAAGTVGILPQDPQLLFLKKTVREDLLDAAPECPERGDAISSMVRLCALEGLLDRHPYDLSGGEQQRLALAKILLRKPDILLLDEPTKGLDAAFKDTLAGILDVLMERGTAVITASHDVEFCAAYAHRCVLLFDGSAVSEGPPRAFFSGNSFYTTAASRMARTVLPRAVTADDIIRACGGTLPPPVRPEGLLSPTAAAPAPAATPTEPPKKRRLPLWRRIVALLAGIAAVLLLLQAARVPVLPWLSGGAWDGAQLSVLFLLALLVLALALGRRAPPPVSPVPPRARKRARWALLVIIPLVLATLLIGAFLLDGRRYYIIALLVLAETLLPFALLFERRRPQARELVILAVMCALAVAGRAIFFMLPECKPVVALTVITGAALGGEAGFLMGAMTMLVSNILFGQGPWTPFQMFALGLIGLLAGAVFHRRPRIRQRLPMCIFGAVAAVVIYGGIMNPATALLWAETLNGKMLAAYYISGFPWDMVRAVATALFLWFGAEPLLEKLDRIRVKYGLLL